MKNLVREFIEFAIEQRIVKVSGGDVYVSWDSVYDDIRCEFPSLSHERVVELMSSYQ